MYRRLASETISRGRPEFLMSVCWDYRHVPYLVYMLGKRNKTQDFVLERTALNQLSCIPALSFYLREVLSSRTKCAFAFLRDFTMSPQQHKLHSGSCVAAWSMGTYVSQPYKSKSNCSTPALYGREGGGRVTESAKGREWHQLGEVLQEASAVLEMRKQQPKARSLGMSGSLIWRATEPRV